MDLPFGVSLMLNSVIGIVGIFLTFLTVAFAGYELNRARRDSQSRFLFDINAWLISDEEARKFYYRLDYERWQFDPNTFRLSDEERALDKLLYTLNTIQHLIESKHIPAQKLDYLQLDAAQILNNPEVQKYFAWLDTEFPDHVERPYAAARRMAKTLPPFV
jgi:hypothetical protein